MTKLNPWTMPPSAPPASETNVRTPRASPRELTAGPPLLPHAAGASVWVTGWFVTSCLNPEIAPFVTDASTLFDAFNSSWLSTTPGKPRMWSLSPSFAFDESPSTSVGMSAASSFRSARSRPDMVAAAGGVYLVTVAARLTPSPRALLVGDPPLRLLHGGDDVGIRDHPAARTDEPAGTCFAKRNGHDALSATGRTRQHDLGRDFRHDERDSRLGAKQ